MDRTFIVASIAIVGSIGLSIALAMLDLGAAHGGLGSGMRVAGAVACAAGAGLRYWSILSLGEYFTIGVRATPDQVLVSRGPYRVLRHPLYLGLLLLTSGVALFVANPAALGVTLLAVTVTLRARVLVEERLMTSVIGERYTTWRNARFLLVPRVF